MKNLRKNVLFAFFFLILTACFLFHAEKTGEFAYVGLKTWFDHMIISLFPFLVLMNLLLKTGLSTLFIRPFSILLRPFFRNTDDAMFVLFFGFLCGFPLGAKCALQLYRKGVISKENTEYLLCFCNNIGPAYMLGFFAGDINPGPSIGFSLFVCYGIPLLYGLFLRYSIYRHPLDRDYHCQNANQICNHPPAVMSAFPDAIRDALVQIGILGGYMVLFNALRIVPHLLFRGNRALYIATQSMLEISGGLICVKSMLAEGLLQTLCLYVVFSFNGLCCHFQTFSLLEHTPISKQKYMLHKLILCSITILFVWFSQCIK